MREYGKPLFVFEMANNHQGSVAHGKKIIEEIHNVCIDFPEFDFAFKFQYRDLDSFIHPDYKDRLDIKNVKRFQDTRLSQAQFGELLSFLRMSGFKAICTPFDEKSVDNIAEQGYDYIKIASCSFDDWPLLEKIASKKMPVIASAAGSNISTIKNVVAFFNNRGIELTLMHCIAEYPTLNGQLQMNQIDLYKKMFPSLKIGFSTHEDPENMIPIRLAVAKGATVFEKHVGVPSDTIKLNGYSANPNQVRAWLQAAREAYDICGDSEGRYVSTEKEQTDLAALRRGVFVKGEIEKGKVLDKKDFYLAFPCQEGQLVASDLSKYNKITFVGDCLKPNSPIMKSDTIIQNTSQKTIEIIRRVVNILKSANVVVPAGSECEISHHYGIEKYQECGVAMIDCINREYCKKILVLLPGQSHPVHYHVQKEETFVILHGSLTMFLDGVRKELYKGDVMTIERHVPHSFESMCGCVFEEISTTHYANDSFYEKHDEFAVPRKTKVHLTREMIADINSI